MSEGIKGALTLIVQRFDILLQGKVGSIVEEEVELKVGSRLDILERELAWIKQNYLNSDQPS